LIDSVQHGRVNEERKAALAGRHAVVVGCGITGLAAARVLLDRGARVTVLERDEEPQTESAEAAFERWKRPGAPQIRHSHAFLGRLRSLLRDRYPDLLRGLLDAGASELRMTDRPPLTLPPLSEEPGDEDLVALGCRRTTFEWVMRGSMLGRPNVSFVAGVNVLGLIASPERPPVVTGVRYRVGDEDFALEADLVVDASGRNSKAVEWLAATGATAPQEKLEQSGIVYYTRFYRFLPGASEPPRSAYPTAADYNWVKYAVFPADDGVFSVTFAIPLAVPRLKVLSRPEAFDEMVRSIPGIAPWVTPDRAEPIGDPARPVQAMGGLINRLRRFVVDGKPVAIGLFVLGDAAYCTNPLYGRGCAQAFLHADLLGRALDEQPDDLGAAALALERLARREIEPFYRASVLADREAVLKAKGLRPKRLGARLQRTFFDEGLAPATRADPVVFRAFLRMFNMLESPEKAFGSPAVILRSLRVLLIRRVFKDRYAIPDPPDWEEVIARCETAAG
jgi:2-polyprenyl-6-methoxyphenol hydroxylase-like FAD-dependent oxidoreductase